VLVEGGAIYSTNATLDFTWAGFVDTLTGIEGYYYNISNNENTSAGTWDTASPGQLTAPDGNISVYVWAEDRAGNIGQSAFDMITVDTTPPTVSSTNPRSNQRGVWITSTISVTFSEKLNGSSVNNLTFYVNGSIIDGSISSTNNKTFTFTPDNPLNYDSSYTATVTTGVKDLAGNNMVANHVWTFSTNTQEDKLSWGGGGGGGPSTPTWYHQYHDERTFTLGKGGTLIILGETGKQTKVYVELIDDDTVWLVITDPAELELDIGESGTFDTNNNGIHDSKVTLESISNDRATLRFEKISETAPPEAPAVPPLPEEEIEEEAAPEAPLKEKLTAPLKLEPTTPNLLIFAVALAIVIAVVAGWWYYVRY
jgi:hypothetical protein